MGKKSQKGSQTGVKRAKNQEAFSHCAKISHPSAKFSIFQLFLLFFPSGFFIYNAEFDSNSMCLDRLDKFGINNLQKLQN